MNKRKIILTSLVWSIVALFLISPLIMFIPFVGLALLLGGMVAWTIVTLDKLKKATPKPLSH